MLAMFDSNLSQFRELRMLKRYLIAETSAFGTEKATFLGRIASFSAELVPLHSPNFVLKFGPMKGNINPYSPFWQISFNSSAKKNIVFGLILKCVAEIFTPSSTENTVAARR
jgi:hypothetical protein